MECREKLNEYMDKVCQKDVCVAFSGGVDSSVILKAASEAARTYGTTVYAVTFETRLHPKADLPQAKKVAKEAGAVHHIIYVNELDNEEMLNNPVNRCYLCKKYLFEHLLAYAREKGAETVMEGNNADDLLVYRPGTQAVRELGVLSPLAELGITKAQIREMAAEMGLSCASRPSSPCLATRLPYGTPISFDLLEKVDAGEQWMKERGFEIVRLRLHGDILRIEIPKDRFDDFAVVSDEAVKKLKSFGFTYITLDMEGFRSGSMDIHVKA
jgi:uncharacterized protein